MRDIPEPTPQAQAVAQELATTPDPMVFAQVVSSINNSMMETEENRVLAEREARRLLRLQREQGPNAAKTMDASQLLKLRAPKQDADANPAPVLSSSEPQPKRSTNEGDSFPAPPL